MGRAHNQPCDRQGDTVQEPSIACVPGLVQNQATRTPGALAVRCGSESITYGQLSDRSNQVANYIRSLGVAPGAIVGLCLERSINFPVAALAILKAGCAYLPLETKLPSQRLRTMLQEASVPLVLTDSRGMEALPRVEAKVIALDSKAAEIARSSCEPPSVRVESDKLAYVIYTSGSTGAPKAVAVGHDNLLNLCRWHNHAFGISAQDRATLLASIGFDAAVWELWPYLIAGASVHVVDDQMRAHPEQLRDWLVREKITVSFAPTALTEQLLKLAWPKTTSLRFLLTGADTLRHYPPAGLPFTLVNNYGPTECTVVATSAAISPEKSGTALPSIGRAIENAEIYILDSQRQQVRAGEIGEIFIGGGGVSRGYLNDCAMTEARFIPNPFRPGATMYRTGDMGCCLPDGQITFHGRADDQCKINGYRVELNEVASVLNRHMGIRESVVVARENDRGQKQLIAYLVPRAVSPTLMELREFLAKELPEYMIPATFVSLKALPLAISGKVNRAALPMPDEQNTLREETFVGASTPTEQRVANVVASLLGLQQVGVNDNFFYLGGNSLFGTQLIARLREAFQVEISLLRLFDHPTVAELAAEVERMMVARVDAMSDDEAQRLLALNTQANA